MGTFTEIYIDQGADYNNTIYITDDVTNATLNVTGYKITSQLKRSYYSKNVSGNIVCTLTNANTGELQMSMTAANTAKLKPGRYVFDVKMKNNSNTFFRILEGIATVTPGVTK